MNNVLEWFAEKLIGIGVMFLKWGSALSPERYELDEKGPDESPTA